MSHAAWVGTSRNRNGLRSRWQALFQEIDVIVCPPMPTTAFPHDHSPTTTRQLDIDGKKVRYIDQIAWAAVATMTGLPATVPDRARRTTACRSASRSLAATWKTAQPLRLLA